jgi:hypothetical protein
MTSAVDRGSRTGVRGWHVHSYASARSIALIVDRGRIILDESIECEVWPLSHHAEHMGMLLHVKIVSITQGPYVYDILENELHSKFASTKSSTYLQAQ